jgi:hypothetical protein
MLCPGLLSMKLIAFFNISIAYPSRVYKKVELPREDLRRLKLYLHPL